MKLTIHELSVSDARLEEIERAVPMHIRLREPHLVRVLYALGAAVDRFQRLAEAHIEPIWREYAELAAELFGDALDAAGGRR